MEEGQMRQPLWPISGEELQQAFIDEIVQAVLERSDLIKPAKLLRKQTPDKNREEWVDALFLTAAAEAAEG
jgi:hypothetical protein